MTSQERLKRLRELFRPYIRDGFASAEDFSDWAARVQALLSYDLIHQGNFRSAADIVATRGRSSTFYVDMLGRLDSILRQAIADLEIVVEEEKRASSPSHTLPPPDPTSRKVFLVHGHNMAFREAVARFLDKLALEAVILDERPNEGRTVIEKFEANSDVSFAVILLTADDCGASRDPGSQPSLRARQNVILELGYFIGRIGRARVCALYEDGVEIPSDYHGVLYVPLDGRGAWKLKLAQELDAAGISVDLNKALRA